MPSTLSRQCLAPPRCGRSRVTYRIHAVYAKAGAATATVRHAVLHNEMGRQVRYRSAAYTDDNANVVSLFNAPTSSTAATLHEPASRIVHNAAIVLAIRNEALSCKSFMNVNGNTA